MKYGIYIDSKFKEGASKEMAEAIAHILEKSFETHADQKTARTAIRALSDAFSGNTNISNCNLSGK
jgi:hypothetical protein